MSYDVMCMHCEHFIFKLMLNGYDGYCEKHGAFTKLSYKCDEFRCGQNRIYKERRADAEVH